MNCQMPQGHPTHCGCADARERLRQSAQNEATSIALNGLLISVEKERDLWKARCQYNADTAHAVAAERDGLAARVASLEAALHQIGDFVHDKSTGPAVPDALWEVRGMAYDELKRAVDGGIALPSSAELRAELPLYHCRGKGGEYERIGYAKPAGAIKAVQGDSGVIVYRDVQDGALYFRDPRDFQQRMARMPVEQPAPAANELPVGIDSEGGSCD